MESNDLLSSSFISAYKDEMIEHVKMMYPDLSRKQMEPILDKMILDNLSNPSVLIHNNYTEEKRDTSLLSVFNWALDHPQYILAGNATYYKNQYEAANPIAEMLDNFLSNRKKYKKKMFKVGEELGTDSPEYKDLDRKQANEKINANS